jgi:hypothetical protein
VRAPNVSKVPAILENLREFGDADKVRPLAFERVQTHRDNRITGLDENRSVAQVPMLNAFPRIDDAQEKWRVRSVNIEVKEPTVSENVLLCEIPEKRTLATPGFPEHHGVRGSTRGAQREMLVGDLIVFHPKPEVDAFSFRPCSASPSGEAVPNGCDELFE